jgi:glycosyltransferase involved in cell wall biosynthesis
MPTPPLRLLHVIHDFLPRHRAGSELYAAALAREQAMRHHVTILCADYDPGRLHGTLHWRQHDGVTVVELVNNWVGASFEDTYASESVLRSMDHALRATGPDVVHLHSLLNLSFDFPRLARRRQVPTVATLHDYSLVCASGGQRVHRAEAHVCHEIEPDRCARCFRESPFQAQRTLAALGGRHANTALSVVRALRRRLPRVTGAAGRFVQRSAGGAPTPDDLARRLARGKAVFGDVDLFVAPSRALAESFVRLGLPGDRLEVSGYGLDPFERRAAARPASAPLAIGFVGTLAWHKGAHVLLEAARLLPAGRYELRIFGDPAVFPEYTRQLQGQARDLPVEFRGAFEPSRRGDVYGGIDVLVVPSIWPENSPFVVHEAFHAGVPVVASRIGGLTELVDDGVNGRLFEAASPAALADVLATLVADRQAVGRLAAATPKAKTIADDAREYDRRYERLRAGRDVPAGTRS